MGELAKVVRADPAHGLPALPEVDAAGLMASVVAGMKPTTRRAYQGDLADFARFLGLASADDAANALIGGTAGQPNMAALRYKQSMIDRGLAVATINRRLSALRKVVEAGATIGRIEWGLRVKGLKSEPREDRRGPDASVWRRMLAAAIEDAASGEAIPVRNLAVVRCLHDMALRRGELAALDVRDLDVDDAALWIVGKGRREKQRLSVPAPTLAALVAWLEVRGGGDGPLLIRLDAGVAYRGATRLDADYLNRIVEGLGVRASSPRRTRAHGLRHAAITRALDLGHDIRKVRKFSRHVSIETVARYDDSRGDTFGEIAGEVAGDA